MDDTHSPKRVYVQVELPQSIVWLLTEILTVIRAIAVALRITIHIVNRGLPVLLAALPVLVQLGIALLALAKWYGLPVA